MTRKEHSIKQGLTPIKSRLIIITRVVVFLIGLAVISVCGILLPELAREEAVGKVNPPSALPYLGGAWVLTVPIFVGLYQALKLLRYIDTDKAFSHLSVTAIQNIKMCAIIFSVMIVVGAIATIILARLADPGEDVTHIFTLGSIFTFASSIVATFAAVLQKLLQDAIHMKSENDLTV